MGRHKKQALYVLMASLSKKRQFHAEMGIHNIDVSVNIALNNLLVRQLSLQATDNSVKRLCIRRRLFCTAICISLCTHWPVQSPHQSSDVSPTDSPSSTSRAVSYSWHTVGGRCHTSTRTAACRLRQNLRSAVSMYPSMNASLPNFKNTTCNKIRNKCPQQRSSLV